MIAKLMRLLMLSAFLLSTVAVAGCSNHDAEEMAMAPLSEMPAMVRMAPQPVREAYRFAAVHEDELSHIPCYCGCGPMGHESSYACFWQEDGSLDTHALGCGICVDIALDTMRALARGHPLPEVRAQIDADYARFGPPTDTPLPVN